ncbi:MAG: hypothetical protein JNN07_14645 [Verrucomicrobiales bacterium]|nr:hypothetical protein [Verrucomicrobiales bacterium]
MPHTNQQNTGNEVTKAEVLQSDSGDEAWVLERLRAATRPPAPVPEAALAMLAEAATGDTSGSQAARSFLFWLVGRPDPAGYEGRGGLELRRLDQAHKAAALELLAWWAGPTQSDRPLYELLSKLVFRVAWEDDRSAQEHSRLGET